MKNYDNVFQSIVAHFALKVNFYIASFNSIRIQITFKTKDPFGLKNLNPELKIYLTID